MKYIPVIKTAMIELIKSEIIKKTDSSIVYEKFSSIYKAGMELGRKCSTQNHRSPIALYDSKMRFIKRWRTVMACVKEIGFSESYLHQSAKAKKLTSKGYFIKTNKKHK